MEKKDKRPGSPGVGWQVSLHTSGPSTGLSSRDRVCAPTHHARASSQSKVTSQNTRRCSRRQHVPWKECLQPGLEGASRACLFSLEHTALSCWRGKQKAEPAFACCFSPAPPQHYRSRYHNSLGKKPPLG